MSPEFETDLRRDVDQIRDMLGIPNPNSTWTGPHSCRNDWIVAKIIIGETARHYGIKTEVLLSRKRTLWVVWPRQVAMYLVREKTGLSLAQIGTLFGGYHHGTVLHAERLVKFRVANVRSDQTHVEALISEIATKLW